MAVGKYGIARFQSAIQMSKLPPQDQQNPIVNNNSNSSKDGNYAYNPHLQRAQEPVITSSDGNQSVQIEQHIGANAITSNKASTNQIKTEDGSNPYASNYGSRVLKLQAMMANSTLSRQNLNSSPATPQEQTLVQQPQVVNNADNSANLNVNNQLGTEKANYKEVIDYVKNREQKDFDKKAMFSALAGLGDAIGGGNVRYQEYWSGGLVK